MGLSLFLLDRSEHRNLRDGIEFQHELIRLPLGAPGHPKSFQQRLCHCGEALFRFHGDFQHGTGDHGEVKAALPLLELLRHLVCP